MDNAGSSAGWVRDVFDQIRSTSLPLLLLALGLHTCETFLNPLAWRTSSRRPIRVAARSPSRSSARTGGIALNAILPAQAGTVAMLGLLRAEIHAIVAWLLGRRFRDGLAAAQEGAAILGIPRRYAGQPLCRSGARGRARLLPGADERDRHRTTCPCQPVPSSSSRRLTRSRRRLQRLPEASAPSRRAATTTVAHTRALVMSGTIRAAKKSPPTGPIAPPATAFGRP